MPKGRSRPTLSIATKQSPARDLTLQKYIQLSTQKDGLQNRLTHTMSSSMSPSSPASPNDPFAISPVRTMSQPINYHSGVSNYLSASQPTHSVPFPYTVPIMAADQHDEERLADINHQIKITLTDLLNHESVRHDEKFRHWVQERLMEAELDTKKARRRTRRRSSIDREAVNSIAENMLSPDMYRFGATL